MQDALEFSNAAFLNAVVVALNGKQPGARGCIAIAGEAFALMRHAERRSDSDFASAARRA